MENDGLHRQLAQCAANFQRAFSEIGSLVQRMGNIESLVYSNGHKGLRESQQDIDELRKDFEEHRTMCNNVSVERSRTRAEVYAMWGTIAAAVISNLTALAVAFFNG